MAAASEATKNSIGWGRPSSDMNARDWVRRTLGGCVGTLRRELLDAEIRVSQSNQHEWDARTLLNTRLGVILASDLNINKVNFELLVSLDTDKEGGSTSCSHDFVGVVARLEDEGERTFQLLQYSLDQVAESRLLLVLIEDILGEDGNGFSVGFGLELVSTLLEDVSKLRVVGHNAVVDDDEI